jgi:hypothetical protein
MRPWEKSMSGRPSTEAIAILRELYAHVSTDCPLNGSQKTDRPFGHVPIGPGHFWPELMKTLPADDHAPVAEFVRELDTYFMDPAHHSSRYPHRAELPVDQTPDSLWAKLSSVFEARKPDSVDDVITIAHGRVEHYQL